MASQSEQHQLTDPLLCFREALKAGSGDLFKHVHMRNAQNEPVGSVEQAASVVLSFADVNSETSFPAGIATRVLRSRDEITRNSGNSEPLTPETKPDAFMPLISLVFAIQQRDERAGAYLRNATMAEMIPFPALERSAALEYLLGKRDAWDGVVPMLGEVGAEMASISHADEKGTAAPVDEVKSVEKKVKRVYVPDTEDAEFVRRIRSKYEIILLTRDDAVRGMLTNETDDGTPNTRASSDLLALRALIAPNIEAAKRRLTAPGKPSSSSARPSSSSQGARKARAQDPIILLSNSPTALVNMHNVKSLLEDGLFIPPDEARKQAGGIPELVVSIRAPSTDDHASGGTNSLSRRILVVDSADAVNRLGNGAPGTDQDPWSRVIAVFTTGQAWQFKSYRWTDPRDLFRNGVFLMPCMF